MKTLNITKFFRSYITTPEDLDKAKKEFNDNLQELIYGLEKLQDNLEILHKESKT